MDPRDLAARAAAAAAARRTGTVVTTTPAKKKDPRSPAEVAIEAKIDGLFGTMATTMADVEDLNAERLKAKERRERIAAHKARLLVGVGLNPDDDGSPLPPGTATLIGPIPDDERTYKDDELIEYMVANGRKLPDDYCELTGQLARIAEEVNNRLAGIGTPPPPPPPGRGGRLRRRGVDVS